MRYKYIGPNPGHGEIHRVVINQHGEIVTISESLTHSWMGPKKMFLNQFEPLANQ